MGFPHFILSHFTQLLGLFHISRSFPASDVWILRSDSEVINFLLLLPGQEFVKTMGEAELL